ncbi:MAG: hypothetical protein HY763_05720 [Planctomycetes bacterium]|nr:hypothetical protein [Planctomycetota bacterium]
MHTTFTGGRKGRGSVISGFSVGLVLFTQLASAGGQCGEWASGFHVPGVSGAVRAAAVYDDGSGPALYVGGTFNTAGPVVARNLARWNGTSWSSLGGGLDSAGASVNALAVFDDGSGPALYVGGAFTSAGGSPVSHLAKWNGSVWSDVGGGTNQPVLALAVYDDGGGAALYAGGTFTSAGGVSASRVARWDGSTWTAIGSGLSNAGGVSARAFAVFDSGSGAELYVGGSFNNAGGTTVSNLARWDGGAWFDVGGGANNVVYSLTVFDHGTGPMLYAGGAFGTAGGVTSAGVARWDGAAWSALGSGLGGGSVRVDALGVSNVGGTAALLVGGQFNTAGGVAAANFARWDGSNWLAPAGGFANRYLNAFAQFDDGGGAELFVGGSFGVADNVVASSIARWDGASWSALGGGNGLFGVDDLGVFDLGGGPALYVGGSFPAAGGTIANNIARWTGSGWAALSGGVTDFGGVGGGVSAIEAFDDGSGMSLFVGGSFNMAGGAGGFFNIARWNGTSWSAVGGGSPLGPVSAIEVFDDGGGAALYAAGSFSLGNPFEVARWDGMAWTTVGGAADSAIHALGVFNDGGGPALYAGGDFTSIGGVSADFIAKWNGVSWSPVGTGTNGFVAALTVFDDGGGPDLYVGGGFSTAGGVAAVDIARWDGVSWSAVGSGTDGAGIQSLAVFTDSCGSALYAGGQFLAMDGVSAARIARWDGASWSALDGPGSGVNGNVVTALGAYTLGGFPALFVGGDQTIADATPSAGLSVWRQLDCNANGVPDAEDIALGTSEDCNTNGTPDECDIDDASSLDCQPNGVPDECDLLPAGGSDDCDVNLVPDECDLASGAGEDCQPNGILDQCDIALGTSLDVDLDEVPDECQGTPPLVPPPPDDAVKNRYIAFTPDSGANTVAFRVRRAADDRIGWVDAPDAAGISRLAGAPVFRVWPEPVIRVTGCEIAPQNSYDIQSTPDGSTLSIPLTLATTDLPGLTWGDCVGALVGGSFTPPNGIVNILDVFACVLGFQQAANVAPGTWTDVAPACPDANTDFLDTYWVFKAFQALPYPFPSDCAMQCNCEEDGDCDDGLFCNGDETCASGRCLPGPYPCPGGGCVESTDQCDLFADAPPQVRLRPVSATGMHTIVGNEIQMNGGGQQVKLEVYVAGWDLNLDGAPTIGLYQVTLDGSGFSSGGGDALLPLGYPATPADGVYVSTNVCSGGTNPGTHCTSSAQCLGGGTCLPNPAYVFPAQPLGAVRSTSLDFAYGGFSIGFSPDNCPTDTGTERYAGTLIVEVPAAALGNYTLGFIEDPAVSFVADCAGEKFSGTSFVPAVIHVDACTGNAQCDDGRYCTGTEVCDTITGRCASSGSPCTTQQICDEASDQCIDFGACCFDGNTACVETNQIQCETPPPAGVGGLFLGAGSTCPEQNAVIVPEGGGTVFVHVIGPPVDCSQPPRRIDRRGCPPGGPYSDAWVSDAGGSMCHNFGSPETDPVPAGFFGAGSDVFGGVVCVQGAPLGVPGLGNADTVIQRSGDPFDRCAVPTLTPSTVNLDIAQLKMVSTSPITVTYNGGQSPEQWDVEVGLSPGGLQPGTPQSTLTATKNHGNGGTYVSTLYVQPRFTFTKVGTPGTSVVLDTLAAGTAPVELDQTTPHPWVSDLDPNLAVQVDLCSDFHPNIADSHPEAESDCNGNSVRDKCDIEQAVSADCNANARPDECDIAGGLASDVNANGVPDACETQTPLPAGAPQAVPKNRYLSFVPNNSIAVSFQVRHVGSGRTMWVAPPASPTEIARNVGRLVSAPQAPRVWTEPMIHATGCVVVPVAQYEIRATADGQVFTAPLSVSTIAKPGVKQWADTVGAFAGTWAGPDGFVNVNDIQASIHYFQGNAAAAPLTWVDLEPQIPNVTLNFTDVFQTVKGFQGGAYPFALPAGCP